MSLLDLAARAACKSPDRQGRREGEKLRAYRIQLLKRSRMVTMGIGFPSWLDLPFQRKQKSVSIFQNWR